MTHRQPQPHAIDAHTDTLLAGRRHEYYKSTAPWEHWNMELGRPGMEPAYHMNRPSELKFCLSASYSRTRSRTFYNAHRLQTSWRSVCNKCFCTFRIPPVRNTQHSLYKPNTSRRHLHFPVQFYCRRFSRLVATRRRAGQLLAPHTDRKSVVVLG